MNEYTYEDSVKRIVSRCIMIRTDDSIIDALNDVKDSFKYKRGYLIPKKNVLLLHDPKSISLRNGMLTIKKALGLPTVPRRIKADLPEEFYNMLDERTIDDEDKLQLFGAEASREILKLAIKERHAKNSNKRKFAAVQEKGLVHCVREGDIHPTQVLAYRTATELVNEEMEAENKMELDLEAGKTFEFQLGDRDGARKTVYIKSYKDNRTDLAKKLLTVKDIEPKMKEVEEGEFEEVINLQPCLEQHVFQKKRHYYLYSNKPGYGKSTCLETICQAANGCMIQDFNNMCGVRPSAQFLCKDEYSYKDNVTLGDLKALTGGVPESFKGNRKSHGQSFRSRKDVQVIIASNYHLFEGVGSVYDPKTRLRFMPHREAKQLFDRFHINKLDDSELPELIQGAALLSVKDEHYEVFGIRKVNAMYEKRPCLVKKYLRYIQHRIPRSDPAKRIKLDENTSENEKPRRREYEIIDAIEQMFADTCDSMEQYLYEEKNHPVDGTQEFDCDLTDHKSPQYWDSSKYWFEDPDIKPRVLDEIHIRYLNNLARYYSWHRRAKLH